MTNMVKAYSQVVTVRVGQQIVSMTIAQKQNQSGLSSNQRLLILVHDVFLGYISKVKMTDQPEAINPTDAKVKLSIKNLYNVELAENILKVRYTSFQDGKLIPKEWVYKFNTPKLAELWKQLIDYEIRISKKQKQSKVKKSSAIKKMVEVQKPVQIKVQSLQESREDDVIPIESRMVPATPKKSTVMIEGTPVQAQGTFDNDLFGDDSEDENDKSKQKIIIKDQSPSPPPQFQQISPQQSYPYNQQSKPVRQSIIKRSRVSELSLPLIQEQSIEPPIQQRPIRREVRQVREVRNQPQVIIENKIERQPQQKRQSQEEKQLKTIHQIVRQMQEKNKKIPINQIHYDRQQAQEFFRPYRETLPTPKNPKQMERIINAVLDRMRGTKQYRSVLMSRDEGKGDWIYKQLTSEQTSVIINFNTYCSGLMSQLVFQIYNNKFDKFKMIKVEENMDYFQIEDIEIKVPSLGLKQKDNQNQELKAHKAIKNQFKAYKYFYRIVQNKGILRVPLSCLCQFSGIVALFKAKPVYYQNDYQTNRDSLSRQLSRLQDISSLPLKKLLKPHQLKPLNQYHYNSLKRGETDMNFKCYFVDEINQFFVFDINNNTFEENKVLRMELVQRESTQNVLPYVGLGQEEDASNSQAERQIVELSGKMGARIQKLALSLNNLQFYFVHPTELSKFVHNEGVNMKYLGKIYSKTHDHFVRSLLQAQMVARASKKLLNRALQDTRIQEGNFFSNIDQLQTFIAGKVTDFLNLLLGNGLESQTLWKLINKSVQNYYGIQLESKKNMNKGQLLISLACHCQLQFKWRTIQCSNIFRTLHFFSSWQLRLSRVNTKSFTPHMTKDLSIMKDKLEKQTHQNFNAIVEELNLKTKCIPEQVELMNLGDKMRLFLANFIEPEQLDWDQNFSHLSIFNIDNPTLTNFKLDLKAIQYYLSKGNKFKYLSKFNGFNTRIQKIFGNNHPVLSELYQLFSRHHKARGEIEDSISFMKSSILNLSALSGDSTPLIAQKFYEMFKLLKRVGRQKEAEGYLNKARKVLEASHTKNVILYVQIKLEIIQKLYKQQSYRECLAELEYINQLFDLYDKVWSFDESQKVITYQLLSGCLKNLEKKQDELKMCQILQKKLNNFSNHQNYQEVLWIIVETIIRNCHYKQQDSILKLIKMIPIKEQIRNYKRAFELLKRRNREKTLLSIVYNYCQNSPQILSLVIQKRVLNNWSCLHQLYERSSLFDFVANFQELIYLFGKDRFSFISGLVQP